MHKLRQKASGRRVRYQSEGGFDLDLSYVTDRVIAMPIPSEQKLSSILKNNINEVVRFLDQLHPNHYRVYNLCLEGKYDYEKFKGRVSGYQFGKHTAPTLRLIVDFVNDAADWLDLHPRNVCVIHCNNGKGRTGTMAACLLLRIGACSTASEALQLFANRRTTDGKAVVKHPSQLRYVSLYDQFRRRELLFSDVGMDSETVDVLQIDGRGIGDASIEKNIPRIITGIRLSSAPQFRRRGGSDPWFSVDQKGKRIFFSPPLKGVKSNESVYFSALRIIVEGDIRLDFYHKDFKTKMFSCSLHTAAFRSSAISLPKRELDLAWKDKNNKHFPANFKLEIFLAAAPDFEDEEQSNSTQSNAEQPANSDTCEESSASQDRSRSSTERTPRTSENGALTSALTRMRASAQLETVSTIGSRCARCREVLGPDDFYLEVSGLSIHWDCLQCNDCGRVFGEGLGGAQDSVVLMREEGGVGCVNCGDFRNFFPACARCGEPVTSEEDCCVSVPAATTYWHVKCFACVRCAAPLLFSDEDALWRIEPTTGMPICFFHSSSPATSPITFEEEPEPEPEQQPSPPPPSPASGFLGPPRIPKDHLGAPPATHAISNHTPLLPRQTSSSMPRQTSSSIPLQPALQQPPRVQLPQLSSPSQLAPQSPSQPPLQPHFQLDTQPTKSALNQLKHPSQGTHQTSPSQKNPLVSQPHLTNSTRLLLTQPSHLSKSHSQEHLQPRELHHQGTLATPLHTSTSNASKQCAGCKVEIVDGQEVLSVGGSVWHPGCLVCAHCHLSFSSEHRAVSVHGKVYCRDDFEKLFGVLCDRCHNVIEPGAGYFNTGAKQYHATCLSCSVCDKKLSAGTFFMRNDSLLCEQHKNFAPSSRAQSAPNITESQFRQPPPPSPLSQSQTMKDSGEALCHGVASLIKTAKDTLLALDNFDKKEFVGLAKQLALQGKEYSAIKPINPNLADHFNRAHESLVLFCSSQLHCKPPQFPIQPTCESLERSRLFLLQHSKLDCNWIVTEL